MPDATDSECTAVSGTGGYELTRLAQNTLNLKNVSHSLQLAPKKFSPQQPKEDSKKRHEFCKTETKRHTFKGTALEL